jgi:hypothetical protein
MSLLSLGAARGRSFVAEVLASASNVACVKFWNWAPLPRHALMAYSTFLLSRPILRPLPAQ